jgi:branched-chain amino acid aminotransferase
MHWFLADREARRVDPQAMALLLDRDGHVTETSTANFLIVKRGDIISPSARRILPGISRDMVVELAGRLGIGFAERDIQVIDSQCADEAFLTGTSFCLMPVTRLNGVPIGDGNPGPVSQRLLAAWSAEVGVDIHEQIVAGARLERPT